MVDIHSNLRILNCAASESFVENVLADVFPCNPVTTQKTTVLEYLAVHIEIGKQMERKLQFRQMRTLVSVILSFGQVLLAKGFWTNSDGISSGDAFYRLPGPAPDRYLKGIE